MVSIAGSKGRITPLQFDWDQPPPLAMTAERLFSGEASISQAIAELQVIARSYRVPVELSVETNMICNLSCCYCYLQERNSREVPTSPEILAKRLDEVVETGCARLIAMVGKEPLVDDRAVDLLDRLARLDNKVRLVMVTNGTLVERKLDRIAAIPRLTNLDVSLDGLEEVHDEARGRGSFRRAFAGLDLLRSLDNVGSCFATAVLHRKNLAAMPAFVRWLFDREVFDIHLAPVRNYTLDPDVQNMTLNEQAILRILDDLILLGESVPKGRGQLLVDLNEEFTWLFLGTGRLRFDQIRQDSNGVLYVRPSPQSELFLKLNLFMPYYWKSARISHDGWFLSELDTVAWIRPEEAAGNVKDHSVERLFSIAKSMSESFDAYHGWFLKRHLGIARKSIDIRKLVPASAGEWKAIA